MPIPRQFRTPCPDCDGQLVNAGATRVRTERDTFHDAYLYECQDCGAVWQSLGHAPWLTLIQSGVADVCALFAGAVAR